MSGCSLILVGWFTPLWRWIQRQRAGVWPTAPGQVEYASVNEAKSSFWYGSRRGNWPSHIGELGYSYFVTGNAYNGQYKRDFWSEEDALEFVRDLKNKPVTVQYHPNKPSKSALLESSVETLLNTCPPKQEAEVEVSKSALADTSLTWPKPVLWALAWFAGMGWC